MLETQGYPAQAARAAAQTMNNTTSAVVPSSSSSHHHLPPMQPGATMQAMANFQQAAAAAMQAAMQGMHGVSVLQLQSVQAAPGQNAQQAYTDTMTALAMQQAAAAHMGVAFLGQPVVTQQPQAAAPPTPQQAAPKDETKESASSSS